MSCHSRCYSRVRFLHRICIDAADHWAPLEAPWIHRGSRFRWRDPRREMQNQPLPRQECYSDSFQLLLSDCVLHTVGLLRYLWTCGLGHHIYILVSHYFILFVQIRVYRCVPSLFGELGFCRVWSLCFIMWFCRRLCLWSACRPSSQERVLGVPTDSQLKCSFWIFSYLGLCKSGTAHAHDLDWTSTQISCLDCMSSTSLQ